MSQIKYTNDGAIVLEADNYVSTNKQIRSTYNAPGQAPFKVLSNVLVENLNADMLDGQHAVEFVNTDNSGANTYVAFWTADNRVGGDANFTWDSIAKELQVINGSKITLGSNNDLGTVAPLLVNSIYSDYNTDVVTQFVLERTGSSRGPNIQFLRKNVNNANNDILSVLTFVGNDKNNDATPYSRIGARIDDNTAGSHGGSLYFSTWENATENERLTIKSDGDVNIVNNLRVGGAIDDIVTTKFEVFQSDGLAKNYIHLRDTTDVTDFLIYYDGAQYAFRSETGGTAKTWLEFDGAGDVTAPNALYATKLGAGNSLGTTGQILTANADGSIYWGPPSSGEASYIQRVYRSITATSGQTDFDVQTTFTEGSIDVFLNGVHLEPGTDYTENSATNTVTLAVGAAAGDIVEIAGYDLLGSVLGVAIGVGGSAGRVAVWDNTVDLGGDANFTWDTVGSRLTVSGVIQATNAATAISIHNTSEFIGYIGNNGGNLFINAGGTNDVLELQTNDTERLRITSDGDVGIGTINPDNKLHVAGSISLDAYLSGTPGKGIFFRDGFNESTSPFNLAILTHDFNGEALGNTSPDALMLTGYDGVAIHTGSNTYDAANIRILAQQDGDVNILGNTKIGGSAGQTPISELQVQGVATGVGNSDAIVNIDDTTAMAADVGGTLALRGYDGAVGPTMRTLALIKGGKANATEDNFDGYLGLFARSNGVADAVEVQRLYHDRVNILKDVKIGGSAGDTPLEKLHVSGTGQTILVTPVTHASNQNSPYLIVAATSYDGVTSNWGAYGIQHRLKSNSGGTSRITVDTYNGEVFSIDNSGVVVVGDAAGTERMRIKSDGDINILNDVKIGGSAVDTPTERLEVAGGNIEVQDTYGVIYRRSSDQYIIIDNNGQASTAPAIGSYTLTNNAKHIQYNSTTDAWSGTQHTAGALGHQFKIRGTVYFQISQDTTPTTLITASTDIVPGADSTYDLGSNSLYWANTYSDRFISSYIEGNSLDDAAIWLKGGTGAILLDSNGEKRISWNDGVGNFQIRAGHYSKDLGGSSWQETRVSPGDNDGAVIIKMHSDGTDGSLEFRTSIAGTDDTAVSWTNYLILNSNPNELYTNVPVFRPANDSATALGTTSEYWSGIYTDNVYTAIIHGYSGSSYSTLNLKATGHTIQDEAGRVNSHFAYGVNNDIYLSFGNTGSVIIRSDNGAAYTNRFTANTSGLYPAQDSTYDLGSTSAAWSTIHGDFHQLGTTSIPTDFWSGSAYWVSSLGYVGTNGSFGVDIVANGYRNSGGTWTSFNTNSLTGGAIVSLRPTGDIFFGIDNSTTGITGGTQPAIRYKMDETAFYPNADSAYDLGSDTVRWANLYVDDITKTSTTLVTNLNADLLDGYHGSSYVRESIGRVDTVFSSADWDDYTATGIYTVIDWQNNAATNGPILTWSNGKRTAYSWGVLKVSRFDLSGATYILQEYWPHYADGVFSRVYWTNWTAWQEIFSSRGSITTADGLNLLSNDKLHTISDTQYIGPANAQGLPGNFGGFGYHRIYLGRFYFGEHKIHFANAGWGGYQSFSVELSIRYNNNASFTYFVDPYPNIGLGKTYSNQSMAEMKGFWAYVSSNNGSTPLNDAADIWIYYETSVSQPNTNYQRLTWWVESWGGTSRPYIAPFDTNNQLGVPMIAVSSVVGDNNSTTALVTTSSNHGFSGGEDVTIAGDIKYFGGSHYGITYVNATQFRISVWDRSNLSETGLSNVYVYEQPAFVNADRLESSLYIFDDVVGTTTTAPTPGYVNIPRLKVGNVDTSTGQGQAPVSALEVDGTITATNIVLDNAGTQTTGTASSDALDWYEEGSFTPAVTFLTQGNLSAIYNTGVTKGQYTRIGNSVTVHLRVVTTTFTHSTASGTFQITGLPFASRLNNISYGGSFAKATNITAGASDLLAQPFIPNGNSYIAIRYITKDATGSASYNQTNILGTNSGGEQLDFMITITYEAA